MKVLMTGCGGRFGGYVYQRLKDAGHDVRGVGLDGPDVTMDLARHPNPSLISTMIQNQKPDVFINHAGVTQIAPIETYSAIGAEDQLMVNVLVPFMTLQQMAILCLKDSQLRKVIQVSSVAAVKVYPKSAMYPASKLAMESASIACAQECRDRGIPLEVHIMRLPAIANSGMRDYATAQGVKASAGTPWETVYEQFYRQAIEWAGPRNGEIVWT